MKFKNIILQYEIFIQCRKSHPLHEGYLIVLQYNINSKYIFTYPYPT